MIDPKARETIREIEERARNLINDVGEAATSQPDLQFRFEALAYELAERAGNMIGVLIALGFLPEADAEGFAEDLAAHLTRSARQRKTEPTFSWPRFCERISAGQAINPAGDEYDRR